MLEWRWPRPCPGERVDRSDNGNGGGDGNPEIASLETAGDNGEGHSSHRAFCAIHHSERLISSRAARASGACSWKAASLPQPSYSAQGAQVSKPRSTAQARISQIEQ
jgi:hypothetical protein